MVRPPAVLHHDGPWEADSKEGGDQSSQELHAEVAEGSSLEAEDERERESGGLGNRAVLPRGECLPWWVTRTAASHRR